MTGCALFRWLVTGLSLQSLGTDPCPVCVGDLWWTKWHWVRFPLHILQFLLSLSFKQCSIIIFHLSLKLYCQLTAWLNKTLPFLTLKTLVSGGSQQSDCQSLILECHEGLIIQLLPFPVNGGCCFYDCKLCGLLSKGELKYHSLPWIIVLLEKLVVPCLIQKMHTLHDTQCSITVFRRACNWLSPINQSTFKICSYIFPCMPWSFKLFLSFSFCTKTLYVFLFSTMHSMCLAPPMLLDFVFLTIIGADPGGRAV